MHSYRQDQRDNVVADGNGPATVPKEGAGGDLAVPGNLGVVGSATVGSNLDVGTDLNVLTGTGAFGTLNVTQATPASAAAAGVLGTIVADTGFIYVCTATNTWKKVAIATW